MANDKSMGDERFLVSLKALSSEISILYDHPNGMDGHVIAGRVTATALVAIAERIEAILNLLKKEK